MLTLASIIGFITVHWKAIAVYGGIFLILVSVLIWGYCGKSEPKLDEAAIQKAQKAIAENNRKEMIEVLAASDVAEKQIDDKLITAENEKLKAFHEARKKAEAMSNDDLAKELNRRAGQ